jgi:branched-chain amino acid transport system substrate-binding protein
LLCLALAIAAGCDGGDRPALTPAAGNVVRIVSSFPARGLDAYQSKLILEAIDLAIEQSRGATGSWTVEHVTLDGGDGESGDWTADRERANATLAADDPSVVAYIGPYTSGATGISLPITNKAGLLQLSPTATWPGLTLPGWNEGEPDIYYPTGKRNFLRLMPPDSKQAVAAALWAARLGATSAFVLSDGSTYSDGLAAQFKQAAGQATLKVAGTGLWAGDGSALAAQVAASRADALFYAPSTVGQAVRVAAALKSARITVGVFVSDTALSSDFIEEAGSDAEGWHFVANQGTHHAVCPPTVDGLLMSPEPSQRVRCFDEFPARAGQPATAFAENAYVLTQLVLRALADGAGRDRAAIAERVKHGSSSAVKFDSNGDAERWAIGAYRLRNGRFIAEEPITSTWRPVPGAPARTR